MSEFALRPEEDALSFSEALEGLRERVTDFVRDRLSAHLGIVDPEDIATVVDLEPEPEFGASGPLIAFAEEEKKKPQRPERKTDKRPISHDPSTCTAVVCTACNKTGNPK